mgnify:CR=1 FL=1
MPAAPTRLAEQEASSARGHAAFIAKVTPTGNLKITRYVAPTYPTLALEQGIEGWVDLKFTLDRAGAVHNVVVDSAAPAGMFEQAAVSAAAKWGFAPLQADDSAVERRVAMHLQFTLRR